MRSSPRAKRTLSQFRHLYFPTVLTAAFILTLSQGCAKRPQDAVIPGQTTVSELKAQLGEPTRVSTPAIRPHSRLLDYPDGSIFQIERNLVVAATYSPGPDEVTLQTWRHRWKGQNPQFEEIPGTRNPHGKRTFRLISAQARMAVIYDEATNRVVKVVRYGAR